MGLPSLWADSASSEPEIRSESAFIIDVDSGNLVFAKNADEEREIASTGKIFVAMAVLDRDLELDAMTVITDDDQTHAKGGARSRLAVGQKFSNRDLLAAMLIGSDNRATTALGRAVSLDCDALTVAMGDVAAGLGLVKTRFSDPAGLKGNFSTAREMATAYKAALGYPIIAELLGTKSYEVPLSKPIKRQHSLMYYNTNELLHREEEVHGGKTGFTTAAGYCLILSATLGKKELAAVFLGGDGKKTRFADYRRLRTWLAGD